MKCAIKCFKNCHILGRRTPKQKPNVSEEVRFIISYFNWICGFCYWRHNKKFTPYLEFFSQQYFETMWFCMLLLNHFLPNFTCFTVYYQFVKCQFKFDIFCSVLTSDSQYFSHSVIY